VTYIPPGQKVTGEGKMPITAAGTRAPSRSSTTWSTTACLDNSGQHPTPSLQALTEGLHVVDPDVLPDVRAPDAFLGDLQDLRVRR
jgi:hypothetical protein